MSPSSRSFSLPTPHPSSAPIVVYKRRWLVLSSAAFLNLTNAFNWLTFAPIATLAAEFYHISAADVDWFGNAFFIAGDFSFTLVV